MSKIYVTFSIFLIALVVCATAFAVSEQYQGRIYQPGKLKAIDSKSGLKVGDKAPDFTLPSVAGGPVSLSSFAGKKNVVISFVPAAWTPVCSEQWPGYNLLRTSFEAKNTVLLGITEDNIPTLFAWTTNMGGVWFPVLSDFWPHGEVARKYGVLRSEGVSERALFVIDRKGIIRYIDVHDINERPKMETLMSELGKLDN
jgi:peroxiredoxin (alkyl hydroperoxide reductase subunit C)